MMLSFMRATASMRTRLIVIPASLLLLGMATAILVTLYDAEDRIRSESASGIKHGSLLIDYAHDNVVTSSDPDAALRRLQTELKNVRHISVQYRPADKATNDEKVESASDASVPKWFLDFFEAPQIIKSYPVTIKGEPHGELVMSTKPADEVAEIWNDLSFLTVLLAVISAGIISLMSLTTHQTLKPLNELVDGLCRLQRGEFAALNEIRIVELRQIGEQFNLLARSLARTEADNHLLVDRLMSIQEAERKELARELHDEFGASLFGIRAAASCIMEDATSGLNEERTREIVGRAKAISNLADSIQKHNYRILERVRPVILHQIGLINAIRDLVDQWQTAHRDIACEVRLPAKPPPCNDDVSLTSYRFVQECLTNVARHAKAESVRVMLEYSATEANGMTAPTESNRAIHVSVEDDGIGLADDFQFGFGFLGMSERVRKLGGHFKVSNSQHAGTLIEAIIPLADAAAG
jgi:two-component system, NarL family, sensor histidine kinase UhpB